MNSLALFLALMRNGLTQENGDAEHVSSIPGFYALDLDKVKDYLAERPSLCKRVGPAESKVQWQVSRNCLGMEASQLSLACKLITQQRLGEPDSAACHSP